MSFSLVVTAPEDQLELLASDLFDRGALGVELQDREVLPMPGTPPLPEGCGRCIAHFDARPAAQRAARDLRAELPQLEIPEPLEVAEQDWSVAWRAHHKPMRVGPRSWVHPPWDVPKTAPGEARVAIDPGMAFGTGSHPTTSLCLARVDELLAGHPGADLLDVGTGTGVIALLAARLGAGRICGTENDPVALRAAAAAEQMNGFPAGRIGWELRGCDALPPPFDAPYGIVVANILLNTLVELAPQIARKVAPGGHLVLAGLLTDQGEEAAGAYRRHGIELRGRTVREGWVRLDFVRP
ncbi:MAG: 50S ribosomal protein L11 methyltransferase [Myxococcales bacterium]